MTFTHSPDPPEGFDRELFACIKKVYTSALNGWVDAKRHKDEPAEIRYWAVIMSLERAYPDAVLKLESHFLKNGGTKAQPRS